MLQIISALKQNFLKCKFSWITVFWCSWTKMFNTNHFGTAVFNKRKWGTAQNIYKYIHFFKLKVNAAVTASDDDNDWSEISVLIFNTESEVENFVSNQ